MLTGLAEAWWSRVCDQAEEREERLNAATLLAECRRIDGKLGEAEQLQRDLLRVRRRVLGDEAALTLLSANNLAGTLTEQGRHMAAELIHREVLRVEPNAMSANNLALSLSCQGKYAEAERINREMLGEHRHGEEHRLTLAMKTNLSICLTEQGTYVEAEQLIREVLGVHKQVLGASEHASSIPPVPKVIPPIYPEHAGECVPASSIALEARKGRRGCENPAGGT